MSPSTSSWSTWQSFLCFFSVNKVLFCCYCLLLFQTWGTLLNQSYSKENKLGSVTIVMKLLVTIGDQSELKMGFQGAQGPPWRIWISKASTLSVARTTGWCDGEVVWNFYNMNFPFSCAKHFCVIKPLKLSKLRMLRSKSKPFVEFYWIPKCPT